MKKVLPSLLFLVATVAGNYVAHAQQTTTNYCPDTDSDIKLELTHTFNDGTEETTVIAEHESVQAFLGNKEFQEFSKILLFKPHKKRTDCFTILVNPDVKQRDSLSNIKTVQLKYLSEKNYKSIITINYDVAKDSMSSHIRNGY
ncbi:MAG: hypothetical protein ED557_13860 [Balneola sp.]|nr:MAG: hypothetical protein ED557_13860 [Balneola sp.]